MMFGFGSSKRNRELRRQIVDLTTRNDKAYRQLRESQKTAARLYREGDQMIDLLADVWAQLDVTPFVASAGRPVEGEIEEGTVIDIENMLKRFGRLPEKAEESKVKTPGE